MHSPKYEENRLNLYTYISCILHPVHGSVGNTTFHQKSLQTYILLLSCLVFALWSASWWREQKKNVTENVRAKVEPFSDASNDLIYGMKEGHRVVPISALNDLRSSNRYHDRHCRLPVGSTLHHRRLLCQPQDVRTAVWGIPVRLLHHLQHGHVLFRNGHRIYSLFCHDLLLCQTRPNESLWSPG